MTRKLVVGTVSLLLILLFLSTAGSKLADLSNFHFGLTESPFIAPFADVLAYAVPLTEVAISVALMVRRWRLAGLYASFVLMLLFTIYISAMLLSGLDIPCSCGGIVEEMSWEMHIVFNSFFVVASAVAIFFHKQTNLSYAKGNLSTPGAH
ncbi:MAG: hypothetical protein P0Y53_23520 [Candidatus Pseudobacter hemicellulosilyticus]|uniref:Methylamine utilisation protein MauE domain-containing protein n=1 Tax=Candidatus Pseudobacter hemicellulosilyticus TaxID=3121375 RepID=A0AAJ5WRQ3_9BACT|nr:MAG: hypothetical protein P0Y53_23520 [Pseudobacter sp.]